MMIKDIANAFGLTVGQFAEQLGFSRQALYSGVGMTPRMEKEISGLRELSGWMLVDDLKEARLRHEARLKAVDELEQRILRGDEV